jgi:hypothetical protein
LQADAWQNLREQTTRRTDKPLDTIVVRTYKSAKTDERDSRRMASLGYTWDAPVSQQPRAGIGRVAMLGAGALVFKPRSVLVVTHK